MTLGLNYNWETSNGATWVAEADIMFQDDRYIDQFKRVYLEGYYKVDLRLGYVTDNLEITAFIDNAFDTRKQDLGMALLTSLMSLYCNSIVLWIAGPGAGSGLASQPMCKTCRYYKI